MDKNKILENKNSEQKNSFYSAIKNSPKLMEYFKNVSVFLNQQLEVVIRGFKSETLKTIKSILESQKYFGYAGEDNIIVALFCWPLYKLLKFENEGTGSVALDKPELEKKIMLTYRLLCENLEGIDFEADDGNIGVEIKSEHVTTEPFVDQLSRIKNEANQLKKISRCKNIAGEEVKRWAVTVESNSKNIAIMKFIKTKISNNFANKVEIQFELKDDNKDKVKDKDKKNINFSVFVWYDKNGEMRFVSDNFAATESEFNFVEKKLLEKKYFDYEKGNSFILNLFTCYLKKSLEAVQPDSFVDLTEISDNQIQETYARFVADTSQIKFNAKDRWLSKSEQETIKKILPELDQIAVNCNMFGEASYEKFINVNDNLKPDLQKERMIKIKSGKIPLNKITDLGCYDHYFHYFTRLINDNVPVILDNTLIAPSEFFEVIKKNKTPAFHTKIKNLLGPYGTFTAQQCIELIKEGLIKLKLDCFKGRSQISFDKKQDELAVDLFKLIKNIFFEIQYTSDIREQLCQCAPEDKRQLAETIMNHLPNMIDDNEKDRDKKISVINQIVQEQKHKDEFFKLVGADTVINIDDFFKDMKKNNKKVSVSDFVEFIKKNKLVVTQDNFDNFMLYLKNNICVDSSDDLESLMDCVVSLLKDKEFGSPARVNLIEFMNFLCEDENLSKDGDKLADCYYKLVENIIKNDRFANDDNGKCTIYQPNAAKILDYMFVMQNKFKNNPIKIVEIINVITAQPIRECFQFGSFIGEACKVFKKYDFRAIYREYANKELNKELNDKDKICDILNKNVKSPIDTDEKKYEFEIQFDMDSNGHLFLPLLLQHENLDQRQDFCLKLGNEKYVDSFLKNLKNDTSCFDNVLSIKSFDALMFQFKKQVNNHQDVKELPDPRGDSDNREMLLRSELLKPKFSVESLNKIFKNIFDKKSNVISGANLEQFADWFAYVICDYSDLVDKASKYKENNLRLYDGLMKPCFCDDFKLSFDQGIDFVKKLADNFNDKDNRNIVDDSFVVDFITDRCLAKGKKFTPREVVDLTQKLISKLNTTERALIKMTTLGSLVLNYTNFDVYDQHNTEIQNIFLVLSKLHYEENKKIDGNVYELLEYVLWSKFGEPKTPTQLFEYYQGRDSWIKEEIAEIVSTFNKSRVFEINKDGEKYDDHSYGTGIKFELGELGQITKVIFEYNDGSQAKHTAEVEIKNTIETKNYDRNKNHNYPGEVINNDDNKKALEQKLNQKVGENPDVKINKENKSKNNQEGNSIDKNLKDAQVPNNNNIDRRNAENKTLNDGFDKPKSRDENQHCPKQAINYENRQKEIEEENNDNENENRQNIDLEIDVNNRERKDLNDRITIDNKIIKGNDFQNKPTTDDNLTDQPNNGNGYQEIGSENKNQPNSVKEVSETAHANNKFLTWDMYICIAVFLFTITIPLFLGVYWFCLLAIAAVVYGVLRMFCYKKVDEQETLPSNQLPLNSGYNKDETSIYKNRNSIDNSEIPNIAQRGHQGKDVEGENKNANIIK